jgi:glycosyltransferase involved in cell wall biosynthesis
MAMAMRVLMLHNRYRLHGGEERAVAEIRALLEADGHEVRLMERSSAELPRVRAARALVTGGDDIEEVVHEVRRLRPQVVHAHNLHPLFGWRALAAAQAEGVGTVLHLHNFRLFCAIAVAYRDGRVCFRCRGNDTRPGVRHRCRGSTGEAAVYAAGLRLQQPRLFRHADRFVAVSHAQAQRLVELGLPASPTRVLPNFVPDDRLATRSQAGRGRYALASGRLVAEKGFDTAITAARSARVPLVIAGEGPDEDRLRALAYDADIRFTGRLQESALAAARRDAAVVLIPSRWEEPCPYAALDALAAGVPVLASSYGGLPELVGEESVLPPGDVPAWTERLAHLWDDPQAREARGSAGLARARERFSAPAYLEALLEIYRSAVANDDQARLNRRPATGD